MGGCFFRFPFSHSWFLRPSGTDLLALISCRALPRIVPKIRDLKKLFGGRSRNFWYGVEEDWYLVVSALGLTVVTKKKKVRGSAGTIPGS